MEETFDLTWEDPSHVVQTEEVICGMESEILPAEGEQFSGVPEGVAEEIVETPGRREQILYHLSDGNVLVMQESDQTSYQDQLMDCQVSEEIITEHWGDSCPEEIVIGSEEAIGDTVEAGQEEDDIKLPTDQDEYTAARPYPCDFCSRRFRKKGNLMNHMIAHQTDRPHGCNLCGVRYIRKSDLMNHLKIHAYIPDTEVIEEEDSPVEDLAVQEKFKKKQKQLAKRKKREERIKLEGYGDDAGASGSSHNFTYVEEEEVGAYEMSNARGAVEYHHQEYMHNDDEEEEETVQEEEEIRYPVTDPRKPFVCQHCGVAFAREKAMLSHTRLHAEGDSPFECQKCGDMFWDPDQMRDHARNKHGETEDLEDDDDEDYSDDDSSKYGTFYCATCGMSFHRQDNLRRHQRVHIKEEYLSEHAFGHVCNVCGESFPEALDLLAHAEVHARTIEYRCMICGDVMTDESALAVHVQAKHGKNLPPNSCMLCGRACKDRRTLMKHSWDHSKEKVFACSKCTKTFHNKARLKRHMLSHRSKAVQCDVCGEEFPDGRSLMNHRHSHSSVSGRQFPCRECGKTFGSRSSQQIHIRIHTGERPYGCRYCWKAFADGGTLRKHERIHTGEKPYACAVCPRAFNQRVVLREHIRSHHSGPDPKYSNSMTPYCCSVCSDMFATSQDLILHLIHHCDLNTAMKRQPQVRPRKYKRRRKLKPHELDLISNKMDEEDNDNNEINGMGIEETYTESDDEKEQRKRVGKRLSSKKTSTSPKERSSESLSDIFNNSTSVMENVNPVNPKVTPQGKNKQKKMKLDQTVPSRPKMIHTQKTRVPVEASEDGRVRHRTRTLVTRTHPTELKSAIGERIRPRTKNVNYHILHEKLPAATFPGSDQDTQRAVDSILKDEPREQEVIEEERQMEGVIDKEEVEEVVEDGGSEQASNGVVYADDAQQAPPEIASEQTVETEDAVPITMVHVAKGKGKNVGRPVRSSTRHVIGPRSKVRMIKQGMIVSKVKKEPELILPDNPVEVLREVEVPPPSIKEELITIKQELVDPSPLHELAEISMQHAQNLFKCEMCSEVFSDRAQLLVHVPIHI